MTAAPVLTAAPHEFDSVIMGLHHWLCARDYAGYEPYDLLNSPYLRGWAHHQPFATLFVQSGKRVGGLKLRRHLKVPPSHNPKALALLLSAYCDLSRQGWHCSGHADYVRNLLVELRSPNESEFCWGYDWHYVSLRGTRMPAFSPNSVVTVFAAQALFDFAETFHHPRSLDLARSAANWLAIRLHRTVDEPERLCFSYTPNDHTCIFNNSALAGALFARLGSAPLRDQARRIMQFLAAGQAADGSWTYGTAPSQQWKDSFHTGYNLCALLAYQRDTGDRTFAPSLERGYQFHQSRFFQADGAPRYFHNRTYPIDIHACSQAILTFCAFRDLDPDALNRARHLADWTVQHLRNSDGSFAYQKHRTRTDRTPYIRWSQAWMLRALAYLRLALTDRNA